MTHFSQEISAAAHNAGKPSQLGRKDDGGSVFGFA
jgi:hypothetical protein